MARQESWWKLALACRSIKALDPFAKLRYPAVGVIFYALYAFFAATSEFPTSICILPFSSFNFKHRGKPKTGSQTTEKLARS